MKGFKCFGLLLLLSIMVGLSLNVSSDVSAYKYPIDSVPIRQNVQRFEKIYDTYTDSYVYGTFRDNGSPDIFLDPDSVPSGFKYPSVYNFSGEYNSVSNTCDLYDYAVGGVSSTFTSPDSIRYSLQPIGSSSFLDNSSIPHELDQNGNLILPSGTAIDDPNSVCSIYGVAYNDIEPNYPHWNFSTLTDSIPVDNLFDFKKSEPYFYNYNTLTLRYAGIDQGLHYVSNGLKMSDIFGVKVPSFQSLDFNLDLFNDDGRNIMENVNPDIFVEHINRFDLYGSIVFDESYTLSQNASIGLQMLSYQVTNFDSSSSYWEDYEYGTLNGINVYDLPRRIVNINCNFDSSSDRIDFSCTYIPLEGLPDPIDFEFIDMTLMISGCSDYTDYCGDNFISTTGDYTFTDFYIVTNNNSTPFDMSASGSQSGGNTSVAPGGADDSSQPGSSDPNWFSSLVDMFNFSFINPFTPIFALFTNQSTCANIPTIAGMIHSSETQVCPWFSAETRAIVTPVVGIVSMMLVFGFAVRWLGASSGNLFEDSGHIEPPGGYTADVRGRNVKPRGWRRSK